MIALRSSDAIGWKCSPADRSSGHAVHDETVMHEWRISMLDRVENDLPLRIGPLPWRSGEQSEEPCEAVELDLPVGAGVRDAAVLDERSVGIQPVAGGDFGEDRRERVTGEGELFGLLAQHAADGQ